MLHPFTLDRRLFAVIALAAAGAACSSNPLRATPITATLSSEMSFRGRALTAPAKLVIAAPNLNNPAAPGRKTKAQTFTVSVTAYNAVGTVITPSDPVVVRIYGPAGLVDVPRGSASAPVPVPVPSATIGSAGATFRYSGAYFANAMTVTAVSGTASITAGLFGKNRPTATSCAVRGDTGSYSEKELHVLESGKKGGFFISASVGENTTSHVTQIDTGSTGFYISKQLLTTMAGMIGPGQYATETLYPSRKVIKGNYYLTTVTLYTNSGKVTTVPMEVLVTGSGNYMGVGYGRPNPGPNGFLRDPVDNVFLQLQPIVQGTMHPGFVMTKTTLSLGLAASNANGYTFTGLQPFPGRQGDWKGPTACIGFNGAPVTCSANMLLDVGISEMYLAAPSPSPITQIAIVASNASMPSFSYAFPYPLAGATPPAPTKVMLEASTSPLYVNTGRFILANANYLYDSRCGLAGFQPLP
jgi:hypothetical protein